MAQEQLVEVLAHLDYLAAGPKTTSVQNTEIMDAMLEALASELKNSFTREEIRNILWEEFQQGDTYAEYNFPLLFQHGSYEMKSLDKETKAKVRDRFKAIQCHKALNTTRSSRFGLVVPKTPISHRKSPRKSATPCRSSSRPMAQSCNSSVGKKKIYSKKSKGLAVPSTVMTSYGQCANPQKKAIQQPKLKIRDRVVRSSVTPSDLEIEDAPCQSPDVLPTTRTRSRSGSPIRVITESKSEAQQSNLALTHDHSNNDENWSMSRSLGFPTLPPGIDFEMLSELEHYKERCKKAEADCAHLKKERRQMESVKSLSKNETTKVLRRYVRDNSVLKQRLNNREDLEKFFPQNNIKAEATNAEKLYLLFQKLKAQFDLIMIAEGSEEPKFGHHCTQTTDLGKLLSTVFIFNDRNELESSQGNLPALQLNQLVQALTGAAIHCWVFGSEFRSNTMTVTPLLGKYREHIATLYGNETLYRLDTAVHRSMVEEKGFEDVIVPLKSSALTDRLLKVIQPLFDHNLRRKTARKLRLPLEAAFGLAIQIRSMCLIGTEKYESIWPSLGSLFNTEEMERTVSESPDMTNLVWLPLCPGLRAYSKHNSMVDYQGFERAIGPSLAPEYVIKSLVL